MPNQTSSGLEESFVKSVAKPPGRRVWKLRAELGRANWAAIFLDGELYLERVMAVPVLRKLQASGDIPPFLAVFVSSGGDGARHSDYTCDASYGAFISEDVVPWLLSGHPGVETDRTTIVGLSLSGLAAAYTAISYPDKFSAAICQSPSFWWEDERFCSSLPQAAGSGPAFWVSVGNHETKCDISHPPSGLLQQTSQVDACERACNALRAAKYNVNRRVFQGGHDPERWREDLALAIPWVAKSA